MTDLLNIGASGLSAQRTALSTVADNVANANTAGYVRRDARLAATAPVGGVNPLYIGANGAGGVRVAGIARATDAFRIADSRLTAADASRAEARSRWLGVAERQLPDGDGGMGAKLTAVYTAADTLAANPDGELPRHAMLTAIDDAARTIRAGAEGLARVSDGIAGEAGDAVEALNGSLAALDTVNGTLRRLPDGSSAKAAALDERDRLLDGISGTFGVSVAFDRSGAATVSVGGDSSTVLLDARGPALVGLAVATDGRLSLSAMRNGVSATVSPTGGTLAGLVDSAAGVAGRRRQLDTVATAFATQINDWNAAGQKADGTAGTALLSATGGAAGLQLLTDEPAALAAGNATAANGNALALGEQRGPGGIEARMGALVAGLSQSVAAAKAESGAATARADASAAARDEVSGVDLDREAAELIRFQQAYDGSAKIIQIARETLQSILQIV